CHSSYQCITNAISTRPKVLIRQSHELALARHPVNVERIAASNRLLIGKQKEIRSPTLGDRTHRARHVVHALLIGIVPRSSSRRKYAAVSSGKRKPNTPSGTTDQRSRRPCSTLMASPRGGPRAMRVYSRPSRMISF